MIRGRILNAGEASGPVVALDAPLSFWGGFDPATGTIIDVHHPQRGARLANAVVLMREATGSGSAPGALAEALRRNTGPAAILLVTRDVNLAIGAQVAETLYGKICPVLAVSADDFEALKLAAKLRISRGGEVYPEPV